MVKNKVGAFALCAVLPIFLVVAPPARAAEAFQIVPRPLAQNARPKPDETPEQKEDRRFKQINVQMNVLLGAHDYDAIEKIVADWQAQYKAGQLSADDYFNALAWIAPTQAGKGMVDEAVAWTKARPNAYVAWYTLGVLYGSIAWEERGRKYAAETTEAQFDAMTRYAGLAREAFLRSLKVGADPAPTYSQMIRLAAITPHRGPSMKQRLKAVALVVREQLGTSSAQQRFCPAKGAMGGEFDTAREEQLFYLCASLKRDPDATLPFGHFVMFNSPRWGGDYALLGAVLAEIEQTRRPSPRALGEMRATLLHRMAIDAYDLQADYERYVQLTLQAFDAAPSGTHVAWLYGAADTARDTLKNKESARAIYNKIIGYRPGEAQAIAGIGWLDEEAGDLKGYMNGMIAAGTLGMFEAQNNVGYYYMVGQRGLPRDLQQARAWLVLAADQGFAHAREKIAVVDALIAKEAKK